MGQPLLFSLYGKFPQAEIRGKEPVPVPLLGMIPQGTPPIFLRLFYNPCPHRVQINVSQAVDQRF